MNIIFTVLFRTLTTSPHKKKQKNKTKTKTKKSAPFLHFRPFSALFVINKKFHSIFQMPWYSIQHLWIRPLLWKYSRPLRTSLKTVAMTTSSSNPSSVPGIPFWCLITSNIDPVKMNYNLYYLNSKKTYLELKKLAHKAIHNSLQ